MALVVTTRARILDEATRRLCEHGYAPFTVAAVRDALGLSTGSMFHAFPCRAALAAAVYVEGMADYQRAAVAALGTDDDPERALCALIAAHLGWVEDHPGLARFLFSTLPDDVAGQAAEPLSRHNRSFNASLDDFYRRAAGAGLMRGLEPQIAHAICIGPAQEYCRQWTRGGTSVPPRRLAPTLQHAALAALRGTTTTQ